MFHVEQSLFADAEAREETVQHILRTGLPRQRVDAVAGQTQIFGNDEQVMGRTGGVKILDQLSNSLSQIG